ncbi:MAG TPA: hypothetical protein VF950_30370 [Planctomycetota bacterium]
MNPQTLTRRGILVLVTLLLCFLAGHAVYVAKALVAWEEPQRSLKAGSSIAAGLLALLYVGLLARDLRGKPVPASGLALPVFVVVGGNWLSDGFRLNLPFFLVVGAVALLIGNWGLFSLLVRLARVDPAPPK